LGNPIEKLVNGVLVIPRVSDADRRVAREVRADFVVDATGRASRAPRWLKDLGYEPPQETTVNAHIGYATRLYRIPENFNGDWVCAPSALFRRAILFRVIREVIKPARPSTTTLPAKRQLAFERA
jgi:hypothetical protein